MIYESPGLAREVCFNSMLVIPGHNLSLGVLQDIGKCWHQVQHSRTVWYMTV